MELIGMQKPSQLSQQCGEDLTPTLRLEPASHNFSLAQPVCSWPEACEQEIRLNNFGVVVVQHYCSNG